MSEEGRVGRSVGPAERTLQAWSSLQLQWRCSGTSSCCCCCCAGGGGRAADIFVHNNARGRGPSAAGNHGGRQAAVRISRWVAEAASGQCGGPYIGLPGWSESTPPPTARGRRDAAPPVEVPKGYWHGAPRGGGMLR